MTTPASVFDLFKEETEYVLKDGRGREVPVVFRTIEYADHMSLLEEMEQARIEARSKYGEEWRRGIIEQLQGTRENLLAMLLAMERPAVESIEDLAPDQSEVQTGPEPRRRGRKSDKEPEAAVVAVVEKKDGEKPESPVMTRWERQRREELKDETVEGLKGLIADMQCRSAIQMTATTRYIDGALALMTYLADGSRMLSSDKKAMNWVGRLQPKTRIELTRLWQEFSAKSNDANLRKVAEDAGFLPSGESPAKPADSPGETIETHGDFPLAS